MLADDKSKNEMPTPINTATALGICLIGNMGLHSLHSRVPSLGFTNVSYLKEGIPCHVLDR